MKTLLKITETQIKQKGVSALANRPNAAAQYGVGGLSPEELKKWFDKLAEFLAGKINDLQSILATDDATDYIRVPLGEYGIESLCELILTITSGAFAADLLKLYPSLGAAETDSLQNVIYGVVKTAAENKENHEKALAEAEKELREGIDANAQKLLDYGFGYTAAEARLSEDGGDLSVEVTISDYEQGKKLGFEFKNLVAAVTSSLPIYEGEVV